MEDWKIDWAIDFRREMIKAPPQIIIDPRLVIQNRFPVSRRKRIIKKWAQRSCNFRADQKIYKTKDGTYICHPCVSTFLNIQLRKEGYLVAGGY
jgi:hypothetical protein